MRAVLVFYSSHLALAWPWAIHEGRVRYKNGEGTFIGEAPPGGGSMHLTANNTPANGILARTDGNSNASFYSTLQWDYLYSKR